MPRSTRPSLHASGSTHPCWTPWIVGALLLLIALPSWAEESPSPCQGSLDFLNAAYAEDEATRIAFQVTFDGLKPLPSGYTYHGSAENPWRKGNQNGGDLVKSVIRFYRKVCTLLPQIVGTNDNALDSIQYFAWLYYRNDAGRMMVEGVDPIRPTQPLDSVRDFLIRFNQEYKDYMDSRASRSVVKEWIADPRLEIDDYVFTDPAEYPSWNAFFARNLKQAPDGTYPSRPVTMPERDYVVVSPTDCIMNPLVQVMETTTGPFIRRSIENPLQQDTVLDVKGIPISVSDLLANAPKELKSRFDGGSGLACVLMPNTYHHFHSPVDGVIRHAEIVEAGTPEAWGTFGYDDWPNWVPLDGNVGRPGTDFSQFQGFQRGVIIIEVAYENLPGKKPEKLRGFVASIPVGLDTVGSVVFDEKHVKPNARVVKGVTNFGNFFFGGSLNILLFSPIEGTDVQMLSPAVQTRMGNQIGILNTPYPAPSTPWTPDTGRMRDRKIIRRNQQP